MAGDPIRTLLVNPEAPAARDWQLAALKIALLLGLVLTTNPESLGKFILLIQKMQLGTLIPLLAVWGSVILGLWVAAFHPKLPVRVFWGGLIALSTALIWSYYQVSHSQLNMLDTLSFWHARHEAGRASEFYRHEIAVGALVFAGVLAIFALPGPKLGAWQDRLTRLAAAAPLLPGLLIAGVYWHKAGTTYVPMPSQFNALSLAGLTAYKAWTQSTPERGEVAWTPGPPLAQGSIILLVDESVRADYLDVTPGNPFTPKFAAMVHKFIDFGPAVSGGTCSNYSNAILRFGASRKDLIATANTNPTLFQYARKAGYRTVFIDAQASEMADGNLLQNFMTVKEADRIDARYALRDIKPEEADRKLIDIIAAELAANPKVFIYANKNGAHIPFDKAYPATAARFRPRIADVATQTWEARINSYRNAVAWSVDDFMPIFFKKVELSRATLVYTSDHGQRLEPGQITHCVSENADPRMGVVPLMVSTKDTVLGEAFRQGAALSKGKASHFQIAPTLYRLMGYTPKDIATRYDESLFDGTQRQPEMTVGDIFGVFSGRVNMIPIDLGMDYREFPEDGAAKTAAGTAGGQG